MKDIKNVALKGIACIAGTIFLGILLTLTISIRSYSREKQERAEVEGYYQSMEKQMVKDVRDYLEQKGFRNSGVMLTKTVNNEGDREYLLTVHHYKIDRMSHEEQELIKKEFNQFFFADKNCSLESVFLTMD